MNGRPSSAPRIALFGGFGAGNLGNDASLEAALLLLRSVNQPADVSAICGDPIAVTRRFGIPAIAIRITPKGALRWLDMLLLRQPSLWFNWWTCLTALRRCDLVVVAGTGAIHDYRDRPWGWPSRFLRWMLAARLSRVPVLLMCVGAGPVINPLSRVMMKWAAMLATARAYRDVTSRAYMSALGVDESRSPVLADLAFLLPAASPRRAPSKKTICIGMINYRGWRRNDAIYAAYIENLALLARHFETQGYTVRAVIGQTPTDLVAVRDLETRLGRPLMSDEERKMHSFEDATRLVADAEIVVASRYHVQIAALKMRRPVVSLSYGPMNDALLEAAGLGEFTHDIEHIDVPRLIAQCARLIAEGEHYQRIVDGKVSAIEATLPSRLRDFLAPVAGMGPGVE